MLLIPAKTFAVSSDIMIVELQTESLTSATQEYVTLANNSTGAVNITGWRLQYFSASATNFTSPSRTINLNGTINPGEKYIAASTGYKTSEAAVFFSSTFAAAGGHIRLISGTAATEQEHDRLGWGTAGLPESVAADFLVKGSVYKRQTTAAGFVDTDNNKNDFSVPSTSPLTQVLAATNTPESIIITELLPNPAAPATDANDEFIELYNSSSTALSLSDYKLQTGLSNSYSYTFASQSIAPYSYMVFYSSQTGLILSNTTGKARLLSPDGMVLSESDVYEDAKTGTSWQLYNGAWGWSTAPSPSVANNASITSSAAISSNTKKVTSASGSTKKAASVKSATTKSAKPTDDKQKTAYTSPPSDGSKVPVNPFILASVGTLAVGYMIYEYRNDLANKFKQFKRHRSLSKKTGV